MKETKIGISIFDKLFPFNFIANSAGEIKYLGPSMRKLINSSNAPIRFDDYFDIVRPAKSNFSNIISISLEEMVVIKLKNPRAELMGQILKAEGEDKFLFFMNLVVQDADELTELKLDFNDFAIQDPIFDYLMLLQTQRRAIRQADESNQKLAAAHQIALKASETKSQFLANMSHELRTPMNGLLGMASILQETPLDDEQKEYVQTLITSGESMLALVNDILDLSKIEAGYVELSQETFHLNDLLDEIKNTVFPTVQKKNLKLTFNIPQEIPKTLIADRGRLRQIILNLTGNAVKFTAKGEVTLSAKLVEETADYHHIEFRVKDTGIGMNSDTLSSIFSPFVQGDSSMTKKFEGTGLGLSICKKLVNAMEGTISVTSAVGVGSEFVFDIKTSKVI